MPLHALHNPTPLPRTAFAQLFLASRPRPTPLSRPSQLHPPRDHSQRVARNGEYSWCRAVAPVRCHFPSISLSTDASFQFVPCHLSHVRLTVLMSTERTLLCIVGQGRLHLLEDLLEQHFVARLGAHPTRALQAARRAGAGPLNGDGTSEADHCRRLRSRGRDRPDLQVLDGHWRRRRQIERASQLRNLSHVSACSAMSLTVCRPQQRGGELCCGAEKPFVYRAAADRTGHDMIHVLQSTCSNLPSMHSRA